MPVRFHRPVLTAVLAMTMTVIGSGCDGERKETPAPVDDGAAAVPDRRQADELARMAGRLRVMAKQYLEKGEKVKAQRAIGAAQELDRKIDALRRGQ